MMATSGSKHGKLYSKEVSATKPSEKSRDMPPNKMSMKADPQSKIARGTTEVTSLLIKEWKKLQEKEASNLEAGVKPDGKGSESWSTAFTG